MNNINYDEIIQEKGNGHKPSKIDKSSHYLEPIDFIPGRLYGNSHIIGDASTQVQSSVIDQLIIESKQAELDKTQTAHVLLIASAASGFNPNAASYSSSAYGLGQLTDEISNRYGIDEQDKDNINKQAKALVEYYKNNLNNIKENTKKNEICFLIGETLNIDLPKEKIEQNINKYEKFVKKNQKALTDPSNIEKQQKQTSKKNNKQKISAHAQELIQQTEHLCRKKAEELGIKWDEGMEKTALALSVIAVKNKFNKATHIGLSEDNKTIHIADIGDVVSIYGELNTAIAAQTPKEISLAQIEQIENQIQSPEAALAQTKEEIKQSTINKKDSPPTL